MIVVKVTVGIVSYGTSIFDGTCVYDIMSIGESTRVDKSTRVGEGTRVCKSTRVGESTGVIYLRSASKSTSIGHGTRVTYAASACDCAARIVVKDATTVVGYGTARIVVNDAVICQGTVAIDVASVGHWMVVCKYATMKDVDVTTIGQCAGVGYDAMVIHLKVVVDSTTGIVVNDAVGVVVYGAARIVVDSPSVGHGTSINQYNTRINCQSISRINYQRGHSTCVSATPCTAYCLT